MLGMPATILTTAADRFHLDFILRYGYWLLFGWVFLEQIGIPIPAVPLFLAAGALVGAHRLNPIFVLLLPLCGTLLADFLWYELGRRKGAKVIQLLCKISMEPDSCVRRTENAFIQRGAKSLIIAKFVPGLGIATPPLAGIFRMKLNRFLGMDAIGSLLWITAYTGLGYAFSNQLEVAAREAARLGTGLFGLLILAVAGWFFWKWYRRHKFIRQLRIDRITADQLKTKLDSGEEVVIVDLRGSMDFEADPDMIPGAVHLEVHDVEHVKDELARAPEVVLYCT
jgi:membrane protein DedA with SNARE-associated domain